MSLLLLIALSVCAPMLLVLCKDTTKRLEQR